MPIQDVLFDIIVKGKAAKEELRGVSGEFLKAGRAADNLTKDTMEHAEAAKRDAAATNTQSQAYKKQGRDVNSVRSQLKRFRAEQVKNSRAGNNLRNVLSKVGLAFGALQLANLAKDAAIFAGEAEGVVRAFERLDNSEKILNDLKEATKGTVTELELMRGAVRANNFQIPLESLGNLMAFAKARADDTGESIDYLVNSIVTGIGRKSTLVLDNLGITATQLRDELGGAAVEASSIAEIAAAVGRIAGRDLAKAGTVADTNKNRYEQWAVELTNVKLELGQLVNRLVGDFNPNVQGAADRIREFIRNIDLDVVKALLAGLFNLAKAWIALQVVQVASRAAMIAWNAIAVAGRVASLALAVAQNVLAGNTTRAAAAFRLLTAAIISNPFALVLGTLIALAPLIVRFVRGLGQGADETERLSREQQLLNRAQEKYNKQLKSTIAQSKIDFQLLKETNFGTKERKDLINDINRQYGTTIQNLKDETAFARQVDAAYQGVVNSLKQKVALQVREKELLPLLEEQYDLQKQLEELEAKRQEQQKKGFNIAGNLYKQYQDLNFALNANLGLQRDLLNFDFGLGTGATGSGSPAAAAAQAASDVLEGSIAGIQAQISTLEKRRNEQIKLFMDGALNLKQYRAITQAIEAERKRLNDALEELSPVEPYKAQDESIAEIQKEINSIQDAIAQTEERGFLTPELEAQLEEAKARLAVAQAQLRQLKIDNDFLLQEEEIKHQQEIIKITGEYNGKVLETEEEKNAAIIDLDIQLLQARLETMRQLGTLTELEETRIQNRIAELRLERQKVLNGEQLDQHKQFLDDWKDLELSQRIDLFQRVTQAAFDLTRTLTQIQIDQLQQLTRLQEQRVNDALRIAEDGNTQLLEEEQARLDELNRQRAQYVRQQQAIAALEIVANSAIAISKAAAEGGAAAPFTIAATLIALAAGLAQARAVAAQAAFREGVVDFQGKGTGTSDSNVVRISHGESVITAEGTNKAPKLLTAINEGRVSDSMLERLVTGRNITIAQQANDSGGRTLESKELKEMLNIMRGQTSGGVNISPAGIVRIVDKAHHGRKRIHSKL